MMDNLALAYVTCDKYDHVWNEWYNAFIEHWDSWDMPKYFCGEWEECPFDDFKQISHPPVEAEHWTSKLRAQVEQIPEDYIFVWLDDQIPQVNIDKEFRDLYDWFLENDADALRIMGRGSAANYNQVGVVNSSPIFRLAPNSRYRVSFSPNIYKKSFILEVLHGDESPWDCELNSTGKFRDKNIYAYHIDGWIINKIVQ